MAKTIDPITGQVVDAPDLFNIGLDADNGLTGSTDGSWLDMFGGLDGIKGGLGLGQLGLGILSYLDQKKTAKLQRNLLGQQIDTNKFLLGQAKDRQADIKNQFGGNSTGAAMGGLAASTQTVPGVSATTVPSGAKNPFGSFGTTTDPYSKTKINM